MTQPSSTSTGTMACGRPVRSGAPGRYGPSSTSCSTKSHPSHSRRSRTSAQYGQLWRRVELKRHRAANPSRGASCGRSWPALLECAGCSRERTTIAQSARPRRTISPPSYPSSATVALPRLRASSRAAMTLREPPLVESATTTSCGRTCAISCRRKTSSRADVVGDRRDGRRLAAQRKRRNRAQARRRHRRSRAPNRSRRLPNRRCRRCSSRAAGGDSRAHALHRRGDRRRSLRPRRARAALRRRLPFRTIEAATSASASAASVSSPPRNGYRNDDAPASSPAATCSRKTWTLS